MIDKNQKITQVELVPPNSDWPRLFAEVEKELKQILQGNLTEIYHIGSTAIPGIYAKPIIDVLPVVNDIQLIDALTSQFEAFGYVCMGEYGIPGRRFYWKSKTARTHNIHLFQEGSPEISRHLAFRDFMRQHLDYAQAYSFLKRNLADVFPTDIENYVNGKSSFVQFIDYKTGNARDIQLHAKDSIVIQPYTPIWEKLAVAEIKTIQQTILLPYVSIEHIGSTAVPHLSSKPVIDLFIVLKSITEAMQWIKPLETLGYVFWEDNPDNAHLRFFKGMPPFGEKRTHHVHIVDAANPTLEHRILFRNILRQDAKVREKYEVLKMKLSHQYAADREAYTDGKNQFIESILRQHWYSKPIVR